MRRKQRTWCPTCFIEGRKDVVDDFISLPTLWEPLWILPASVNCSVLETQRQEDVRMRSEPLNWGLTLSCRETWRIDAGSGRRCSVICVISSAVWMGNKFFISLSSCSIFPRKVTLSVRSHDPSYSWKTLTHFFHQTEIITSRPRKLICQRHAPKLLHPTSGGLVLLWTTADAESWSHKNPWVLVSDCWWHCKHGWLNPAPESEAFGQCDASARSGPCTNWGD